MWFETFGKLNLIANHFVRRLESNTTFNSTIMNTKNKRIKLMKLATAVLCFITVISANSIHAQLDSESSTAYAPNSFTPNEDQFNTTFLPVIATESYAWKFTVYDRWGQLVYQTYDQEDGWNGALPNGLQAPEGTYVWSVIYVSNEPRNEPKLIYGHVNLLR
jgi:gliding motility-associated-like protein